MNKDEKRTEIIRYNLIKPFLDKEKNLKELSEECEISYSTLKRWVSAYKRKGVNGLKKTERKDKNTHRTLDDETYKYLEETYKKNPETKILDLHKLINKNKSEEKLISYDTVYRIITNLDPFVKKFAEKNNPVARSSNEVYEYFYCKLDIKILDQLTDRLRTPYLNIIYDSYSKAVCSYDISFSVLNIDEILVLLRAAIFPNEINSLSIYGKPSRFTINDIRVQGKKRLKEAQYKTELEIVFSSSTEPKMLEFSKDINEIYLKDVLIHDNSDIDFDYLNLLVRKYLQEVHNFRKKEKWENNLKKIEIITKKDVLDPLLTSVGSGRKIQPLGIRYLNLTYTHEKLLDFIGKKAEIKINHLDISKIYIYVNGFPVCQAVCDDFLGKEISLYKFHCIKNYILIKYHNEDFNINNLGKELRIVLESGTY